MSTTIISLSAGDNFPHSVICGKPKGPTTGSLQCLQTCSQYATFPPQFKQREPLIPTELSGICTVKRKLFPILKTLCSLRAFSTSSCVICFYSPMQILLMNKLELNIYY